MSSTDQMPAPPSYDNVVATDAQLGGPPPRAINAQLAGPPPRAEKEEATAAQSDSDKDEVAPQSAGKKDEVGGFGFRVGSNFVGVGVAPEGRNANGVGISLGSVMLGVTTGTAASKKEETS